MSSDDIFGVWIQLWRIGRLWIYIFMWSECSCNSIHNPWTTEVLIVWFTSFRVERSEFYTGIPLFYGTHISPWHWATCGWVPMATSDQRLIYECLSLSLRLQTSSRLRWWKLSREQFKNINYERLVVSLFFFPSDCQVLLDLAVFSVRIFRQRWNEEQLANGRTPLAWSL